MAEDSEKAMVEKLRTVPLFSGLKEKQLRSVVKSGKLREYPEGKTIVAEGEIGVGFYLIVEGRVDVKRNSRVLARLGTGNFFGEMSLIDENPRSSDVVAIAPTKCLVLSAWAFEGVLSSNKGIMMNLIRTLIQRLRESNKALSD